jgi:hypothetical protein
VSFNAFERVLKRYVKINKILRFKDVIVWLCVVACICEYVRVNGPSSGSLSDKIQSQNTAFFVTCRQYWSPFTFQLLKRKQKRLLWKCQRKSLSTKINHKQDKTKVSRISRSLLRTLLQIGNIELNPGPNTFKILSHNVRGFTSSSKKLSHNLRLYKDIIENDSSIICLQETHEILICLRKI